MVRPKERLGVSVPMEAAIEAPAMQGVRAQALPVIEVQPGVVVRVASSTTIEAQPGVRTPALPVIEAQALSSNETQSGFRVFGIDIGVDNMGMASILIQMDRVVVEKVDWRPLSDRKLSRPSDLVSAVGDYITHLVDPLSIEPRGIAILTGDGEKRRETARKLIPHEVLIEQQYVHGAANYHALEIQIALMSRLAERYPCTQVRIVGAPARRGDKNTPKGRARMIAENVLVRDSRYWGAFFYNLVDKQHISDAIAMVYDTHPFPNSSELDAAVRWESDHSAIGTAVEKKPRGRGPKAAKPSRDLSGLPSTVSGRRGLKS